MGYFVLYAIDSYIGLKPVFPADGAHVGTAFSVDIHAQGCCTRRDDSQHRSRYQHQYEGFVNLHDIITFLFRDGWRQLSVLPAASQFK